MIYALDSDTISYTINGSALLSEKLTDVIRLGNGVYNPPYCLL